MAKPWFGMVIRPLLPMLPELFAFSVFLTALGLAVPVFVMQVYDRVIFHGGESTLIGLTGGVVVILAFDFILRQARVRILQRASLRLEVEFGGRLFENMVSLPLARLERRPTPEWTLLFRDVEVVRNTVAGPAALMPFDLLCGLLALGLIWIIAAPIAGVLMLWVGIYVALASFSGLLMARANARERDSMMAREALTGDLVLARTTIKALALDSVLRPRWRAQHAQTIGRAVARGAQADTFANVGATLALLGTVVATGFGATAILDQQMSIGALTAASMLSTRLIGPLNQLIGLWRAYATLRQSAQRLAAVFAEPQERGAAALRPERPEGGIVLQAVSFTHDGATQPVFEGLSIEIAARTLTGIRGDNASGKSTLLKLMQGLYAPGRGRVLIDGADIAQFSRADLARWVGFLPQDCLLFTGSIRDNIAIAHPHASDADVTAAARQAGADAMIRDLPDGYDTLVGEAGHRLSYGLRQRVALARALIGAPAIVLLDEPTSHLDTPAARTLRDTLVDLAAHSTVVVATHSSDLLSVCQRVIGLQRGAIVFDGSWRDVVTGRGKRWPTTPDEHGAGESLAHESYVAMPDVAAAWAPVERGGAAAGAPGRGYDEALPVRRGQGTTKGRR